MDSHAPTDGRGRSVGEVSDLTGLTVRTLHHWDEIGLLRAPRGRNCYRSYGAPELDRLQQILLYRDAGVPLDEIRRILDDPAFSVREALQGHLARLEGERRRTDRLIASVKGTLARMEGGRDMSERQRFEALKREVIEENERHYGREVRERHGDEAMDAANARMLGMSEEEWRATQELEERVLSLLAEAMDAGDATSALAGELSDLHGAWVSRHWSHGTYTPEAHIGLARMYRADARFKAYYDERVRPGATDFLVAAIEARDGAGA
ncbi:MAG: MerR family transcriptional regulator [Collinsella sp.]|nr:MerR family transcriptional regulator [Collinsella sp.]